MAKSPLKKFEDHVTRALHKHRGDKSFSTLARQQKEARQMARELHARGFKLTELSQLRGKSVNHLLDVWAGRSESAVTGRQVALSPGTQATYLATLRQLCKWGGKPSLIAKSNATAGLAKRDRTRAENPAWRLGAGDLEKVSGRGVNLVLQGQHLFGLRLKESWCMDARIRDKGDVLVVSKGAKGKTYREVPIRTPEQRAWIEAVKIENGRTPQGTLVHTKTLKDSLDLYKASLKGAGLRHGHGLRFAYAQQRHTELVRERCEAAGRQPWVCPMMGGPYPADSLSKEDRQIDNAVRLEISQELGHGTAERASFYLGTRKGS